MRKTIRTLAYILLCYAILDFVILKKLFKLGFDHASSDYIEHRPYVMFTANSELERHNSEGFTYPTLKDLKDSSGIKIAFFGGSTGYLGDPTIPQKIQQHLSDYLDRTVYVANYSVSSSVHNQHLHYLVEYVMEQDVQLVIFYGGFNETFGHALWEPRPGYPLNYFYTSDLSINEEWLIRNSALFGEIERHTRRFSGLSKVKNDCAVYSISWNQSVIENYFKTLSRGNQITNSIVTDTSVFRNNFLAIYQPFDVDSLIQPVHDQIRDSILSVDYIHDLSHQYSIYGDSHRFDDYVHVNQTAREFMGEEISDIILKEYVIR